MKKTAFIIAAVTVIVLFLLNLMIGRFFIPAGEVLFSLWQNITGIDMNMTPEAMSVVNSVRLPRALVGMLVGAALAASGCAFQGLFQNPLVSQGVLGVSSGASFGAALSVVLFAGSMYRPIFAFIFGISAVILSFMAARMSGEVSTLMLVLGGTVISGIFSALVSLLKYLATSDSQLSSIVFWTMGSLSSIKVSQIPFSVAAIFLGLIILIFTGWMINIMSMGEKEARSLGLSVGRAKMLIVAGATLTTAGAVSITGNIGWVGLIIPHIGRFFVGSDNRVLIPFSMLLGASFMTGIDLLCRNLTGAEIPLGIMTSLVGGPFFIYLLRRYKGGRRS